MWIGAVLGGIVGAPTGAIVGVMSGKNIPINGSIDEYNLKKDKLKEYAIKK
jgi:hypothetical protein